MIVFPVSVDHFHHLAAVTLVCKKKKKKRLPQSGYRNRSLMYLLLTWQVAWRTPQVPSTQWSWSAWCAVWPGAWSCCPTPWRSGWSTGGLSATDSCLWVLSRPTEAWCWTRPGSLSEALLQHWHHATRKSDVCCSVSDREWVTLIFCTVRTGHDLYCYVAAVDVIQWVPVTWGHCSWQQEQVVWGCCHIYIYPDVTAPFDWA